MFYIRATFIALTILFTQTAVAQTAQKIFQDAINFTVKIRSSVEVPYLGDHRGVALGAGFIIDRERGWILTNEHVARPSPSELRVAFKDSSFIEAKKIYVDSFLDLAVIAIDPKLIPAHITQAPVDCKSAAKIGTAVGAFGHPFGLEFTGTRGIVSGESDDDIGKFLRTDASINPGNSGGPLISIDTGKVVGINSASVADSQNQNTNFAIPMTYACKIVDQLRAGQNPSPASLKLSFFEPQFDLINLVVAKNFNDGAKVPLKQGDEIMTVEGYGERIKNVGHLVDALRLKTEGVKLQIRREGEEMLLPVTFERSGLITKLNTISVNGLVIGPAVYSDTPIFPYKLSMQIYSIAPGSYANYIEMPYAALITTIDNQEFATIEEAYAYLEEKEKSENPIVRIETVNLQRREISQIFAFKENFLPVSNLKMIKGQ